MNASLSGLHRWTYHKDPLTRWGWKRCPAGPMEPERGGEPGGPTGGHGRASDRQSESIIRHERGDSVQSVNVSDDFCCFSASYWRLQQLLQSGLRCSRHSRLPWIQRSVNTHTNTRQNNIHITLTLRFSGLIWTPVSHVEPPLDLELNQRFRPASENSWSQSAQNKILDQAKYSKIKIHV